jgi:hypothetical protein
LQSSLGKFQVELPCFISGRQFYRYIEALEEAWAASVDGFDHTFETPYTLSGAKSVFHRVTLWLSDLTSSEPDW